MTVDPMRDMEAVHICNVYLRVDDGIDVAIIADNA
jgi:hypothetical protein